MLSLMHKHSYISLLSFKSGASLRHRASHAAIYLRPFHSNAQSKDAAEGTIGSASIQSTEALKIQPGRLNQTILNSGNRFGKAYRWGDQPHEFGLRRLAGTEVDGAVRDWFVEECRSLGCTIKVDEIGNIFATYPGKHSGNPTAIGSHLDTQPEAGKYDGILGVLAGLEVLRTFKENGYVPNFDVCVVCWFNEEGARFAHSCMGSTVWAENMSLQEAYGMLSLNEEKPQSVIDSLDSIGYKGETVASYKQNELAAHFELHIEQGPLLEDENKKIGIVTGVQAYHWEKITVYGISSHAGTTPWKSRKDALVTASKMIVSAANIAERHGGLFTCGIVDVKPYSINIIPTEASFTVDFRHENDIKMASIIDDAHAEFKKIAQEGKTTFDSEFLLTSKAVKFHDTCINCVTKSALDQFDSSEVIEICSGAGHDSCQTSSRIPTSMIFIPSKDGLSHNYHEYSSPEDIENGFKVLLQSIINYDNSRLVQSA